MTKPRSNLILILVTGTQSWLFLWLVAPLFFTAQQPSDWDNLLRLSAGQRIAVVRMNLTSESGEFTAATSSSLTLRSQRGELTIPRDDVYRVTRLKSRKRLRNILLGAGIGAAAGIAFGAAAQEADDTASLASLFGLLGAAGGAGVGAALPSRPTIYRASAKKPYSPR